MDLSKGRKAIGCKLVLKQKRGANNSIMQHKAQLVAQGYSQLYRINYDEIFAPVTSVTTILLLLMLVVSNRWETYHVDFNSAYLNTELNKEIYMKIPNGHNASKSEKVFKLKKAIYRLKQAGHKWYLLLKKNLLDQGWQECKKDNCIFQRRNRGLKEILAVYIDNVLIIAKNIMAITAIKAELVSAFKTKDLGKLDYILGMCIS